MEFAKLVTKAKELGINEIEVYSVKQSGIDMEFFDGSIDANTTKMIDVMCVRGVYNGHIATVYTENNDNVDFVLNSIIRNASLITKEEPYFIYGGDDDYPVLTEKETNFEEASTLDKINLCKEVDELLKKKCPYVYKTETAYSESSFEYNIVNSNGLNVSKKGKRASLVAELIASKDGDVKTSYDFLYITKMEDINLEEFTDKIIEKAISQFGADSVPSGEYDIVLDKGAARSLLSVFSGVFCATTVLKKMSFLEGKIEQKICGDNITIIDDPLHCLAMKQDSFDDEGVATKTKIVVENGVLKTYLHNLTTAKMMGTVSTGNGFKASVSAPVNVSVDNFYLKPGEKTLEELFETVGNGLYITGLDGLHAGVNQVSGNFSLKCSGYMIENGKKTRPVTLIILTSSFQYMMNNIVEIGNDLEFRGSVGAPSVIVRKMSISGK